MPRLARVGSLYQTVLQQVEDQLVTQGYPQPLCKRLALVVTGLTAGAPATVSGLSQTLHGLHITEAAEPSIARRLLRLLDDPRLDPSRLLPDLFAPLLPQLLAGVIAAHATNAATTTAAQHARFGRLRVVVDESSQEDAVHLLVVGLWYQGLVLPLAVRTWAQNTPLEEDAWWSALGSLLWEVHRLLPPPLRDHVLLLADRGYGHPRLLDLATALHWAWVVRVSGQVRVRLPDGTICPLRTLVSAPGRTWSRDSGYPTSSADAPDAPLAVFKKAGWRRVQVVALWLTGQTEPWLLLTNLPARVARLAEYAQRWAIERLFLTWKSHGWDLEAGRVRDAARVGRLVTALVLASWWRVAIALPEATRQLAALGVRPARPYQLRLPFAPPTDPRPWAGKFSLLSWGARVIAQSDCRRECPPQDWSLPDWDAPAWSLRCQLLYHPTT
jgi:Transposase DDE domain